MTDTNTTPATDESEDAPCTDCDDTGITHQTERVCSCLAGLKLSATASVEIVAFDRWKACHSIDGDFFAVYPDTGNAEFPIAVKPPYIREDIWHENAAMIAADHNSRCERTTERTTEYARGLADGVKQSEAAIVAWLRADAGKTRDDLRRLHAGQKLTISGTAQWEALIGHQTGIANAIERREHAQEAGNER